jgi:hypothetical protein
MITPQTDTAINILDMLEENGTCKKWENSRALAAKLKTKFFFFESGRVH